MECLLGFDTGARSRTTKGPSAFRGSAKVRHPSITTNPQAQQMTCDHMLGERLCKDAAVISWAILDVDMPIGYGLTDSKV